MKRKNKAAPFYTSKKMARVWVQKQVMGMPFDRNGNVIDDSLSTSGREDAFYEYYDKNDVDDYEENEEFDRVNAWNEYSNEGEW